CAPGCLKFAIHPPFTLTPSLALQALFERLPKLSSRLTEPWLNRRRLFEARLSHSLYPEVRHVSSSRLGPRHEIRACRRGGARRVRLRKEWRREPIRGRRGHARQPAGFRHQCRGSRLLRDGFVGADV